MQCQKIRKIFTGPMFTGLLFQIQLHLLSTVLLSGFQSSPGALESTKAVPGNFNVWRAQ